MKKLAVAVMILCGCGADPATATLDQSSVVTVTIGGIRHVGPVTDPSHWGPAAATSSSRLFELYGSFPQPSGAVNCASNPLWCMSYRPHVMCDGKFWPAEVVWGWGTGQMDVVITNIDARCLGPRNAGTICHSDADCTGGDVCRSELPRGASCWFQLEVSYFNNRLDPATTFSNSFGPVGLSDVRITSGRDDGASGGWRFYSLWGTIPTLATPVVTCDESVVSSQLVSVAFPAYAQIKFASTGASRSCKIQIVDGSDVNNGPISNSWVFREAGQAAAPLPTIGPYFWGGYQANAKAPAYTTMAGGLGDSLEFGVARIMDAGYKLVRLVMTPEQRLPSGNGVRGLAAAFNPTQLYEFRPGTFGTGPDGDLYGLMDLCNPYRGGFHTCTTSADCAGLSPAGQICISDNQNSGLVTDPDGSWRFSVRSCRVPFLECAARSPAFQAAFSHIDPGGSIIINPVDETVAGMAGGRALASDINFMRNAINQGDIKQEYQRLTYALFESQHDTNRTFILSDWETDNQLYPDPGALANYLTATVLQPHICARNSDCPSELPICDQARGGLQRCIGVNYTKQSLADRKDAMKAWFQQRHDGIVAGHDQAVAAGFHGVNVYDSIEINNIRYIDNPGVFSMLGDVVPDVAPAYVTYSSWGSTSAGTMDPDIADIQRRLATATKVSPLTGTVPYFAIGELGIATLPRTSAQQWRLRELVKAVYRSHVPTPSASGGGPPLTVLWLGFMSAGWAWTQGFNDAQVQHILSATDWANRLGQTFPNLQLTDPASPFPLFPYGPYNDERLFGADGDERKFSSDLRGELAAYAVNGVLPPQAMMITNLIDDAVHPGSHTFRLVGTFPTPPDAVEVVCDGTQRPGTITSATSSQLSISIPDPGPGCDVFCTFRAAPTAALGSPVFGPYRVCQSGQDPFGNCRSCQ